jgi:hypothetical protein
MGVVLAFILISRARAQWNGARARNRIEATMTENLFDHDRLDVYRLSIEYVASAFETSSGLSGLHRHARDQWLRAAQSIPRKETANAV